MVHLWVRAEQRQNEQRVGLTPEGARALVAAGFRLTVEESATRVIPAAAFAEAGATLAPEGSWPTAPAEAIVFGLKELPEDGTPLTHRHIMFGHAYKGQPAGQELLRRFAAGGGALYDLEYLVDETGRRVAAFGYWAGYAGAAVTLLAWAAQQRGGLAGPVDVMPGAAEMAEAVRAALAGLRRPSVIVIGALGRVGTGAGDLCEAVGLEITRWDIAETAHGGPYPQIMAHDIFLNCILAAPGCPVFVPEEAVRLPRALSAIGDIACDPTSDFSPVRVYDRTTTWAEPALRVAENPPLDVTAIDNLPSLLPRESSEDFAGQLLPSLLALGQLDSGVWGRAGATFRHHLAALKEPRA